MFGGTGLKTKKNIKPLPKMDFLKKKKLFGGRGLTTEEKKPSKIEFFKTKAVWGKGLKN